MVLRSLAMYGFKSFAEKTALEFGDGTTAVIGPNGCGKSNVVDAVRWVFGEQRASALRSASMQDVIFSGSQNRQPLNIAEVTLTIENTRRILPIEYSQVAITRRLYRTGESEYLVNKVPCRLRDITNLFLDTGIGSSAYTTIENMMINQILSDKAEERRILFDEAAGISKYKQRRRDSRRQLEKTRQDLLRITDKVQEATRQVQMLARHVEKARRAKRYREELKGLEVGYEYGRYMRLAALVAERRKQVDEYEGRREMLCARNASVESDIAAKQLSAAQLEENLQSASRAVAEAGDVINGIDREISVTTERNAALEEKSARLMREIEVLNGQIADRSALRVKIEKIVIERESRYEECVRRVTGAKEEMRLFDGRMGEIRLRLEKLTGGQIACINAIGDERKTLSNVEACLNNTLESVQRHTREIAGLESRVEDYSETIRKSREQLATVSDAHDRLLQSREQLLARVELEDNRYRELLERQKQCEAHIESSNSQLNFLRGLDASFEGYEGGVKALLTGQQPGVLGIFAGRLRIADEAMVPVIEQILGPAIQTVVLENDQNLSDSIEYLNKKNGGSARMASRERLAKIAKHEPLNTLCGVVSLRSCVEVSDEDCALADMLLGNIYCAESAGQAMALSLWAGEGYVFVSRDGVVCYGDGTVCAGKSAGAQTGILQRRKMIEKLTAGMEKNNSALQTIIHDKETCIINRDEARYALVEVDEKINQGRQYQQEHETTIRHHENEIGNTLDKMTQVRTELEQANGQVRSLDTNLAENQARLVSLQADLGRFESDVNETRTALAAMEQERLSRADHLKNIELEMFGLANRISQDKTDIERLARELDGCAKRKNQLAGEQHGAAAETDALARLKIELGERLEKEKLRRDNLENIREQAREEYSRMLGKIDEMRKEVKSLQGERDGIVAELHELEMKQSHDLDEQRHIRERMWEAYEIDLESTGGNIPVVDEQTPAALENIQVLKERIRRVGDVNMAALDDYESESARLEELTRQRDDLETAVADLERAIKKLDREARQQFIATFEAVQGNFREMFATLFEGGEAHVELEENVDPLEAAISINVRPAGKKMRGVQLLSGGERALTAIALLFALYQVKPSAYCILDELDAPLDDANVDRFIRVLKKFEDRTQFIIVTHNKRTMECADILYGVTQHEKGVSQIVSVKLEEAVARAA